MTFRELTHARDIQPSNSAAIGVGLTLYRLAVVSQSRTSANAGSAARTFKGVYIPRTALSQPMKESLARGH